MISDSSGSLNKRCVTEKLNGNRRLISDSLVSVMQIVPWDFFFFCGGVTFLTLDETCSGQFDCENDGCSQI